MAVPKPIIDDIFSRTISKFLTDMEYKFVYLKGTGKNTGIPIPYFVGQVLDICKYKKEITFIEYILYLKIYNEYKILPIWTKNDKLSIIDNIKTMYNKILELNELETYLNYSFKKLISDLGYKFTYS